MAALGWRFLSSRTRTLSSFGGPWTEDKLRRIDDYLDAYMKIFTANRRAARLKTTYLDAFAGTGFRTSPVAEDRAEGSLFEDALEDPDANALKKGSAYVALRTDPRSAATSSSIETPPTPKASVRCAKSFRNSLTEYTYGQPTPTRSCRSGVGRPIGTRIER